MASPETKVYRLRGIPAHLDRLGVAQLVQPFLPDGKLEDVRVASLALSCDFWAANPTKTATLNLLKLPEVVRTTPTGGERQLPVLALPKPLILDDTFYGLTPLNEVEESQHYCDCIVISGLGSHPIGSWQPRGEDKSFMWIRDKLPELVPGVRFILYGYDTKLVGSKSFQTVADLAISLINALKTGGWSMPGSKPLAFLAHSLGGVVLKQCLVMLADTTNSLKSILQKTKGAVFFSVPSQGMNIEDIHDMLGDQPNKNTLIAEISSGSDLLPTLEQQITGISQTRDLQLYWAYETQTTPSVEPGVDGKFHRQGPGTIFVSRVSATGNRHTLDPTSTIHIDANHSEMVKFSPGSHIVDTIANILREIIGNNQDDTGQDLEGLTTRDLQTMQHTATALTENNVDDDRDPSKDLDFWDQDAILKSIRPPERDERLKQIDKSAGCSFEWAFDNPATGLNTWLQKGDGLYWVSGRPASGKSTFMKFLHNDKRTSQLLRGWYSQAEHVEANFFFHYRGNLIQKSFEGLLRSILSHIMEQAPGIFPVIHSIVQHRYQQLIKAQSLGSLYLDLQEVSTAKDTRFGSDIKNKVLLLLDCETPRKLFRRIVVEPLRLSYETDINWNKIEQNVISRKEEILDYLRKTILLETESSSSTTLPRASSEILKSLKRAKLLEASPPVYLPKWSEEMKQSFVALLTDWIEAVDLKERILGLRGLSSYRPQDSPSTDKGFIEAVDNIIRRYDRREKIRKFVESEDWTLQKLQETLFRIINQQSIGLDVCIFIDALDEYDGPSECIIEFLQDITKQRNHHTRLKILFSSRPWDKFTEAFGNCPGFRIHDHTENDVRELCLHVIQTECPGSNELLLLVEEIVKRAKGVFLWAKLVLYDLSKLIVGASCEDDAETLSLKLQETLQSLPHDLIEYYSTIVERTSPSFRREAFCLLEVVSKGDNIYLHEVPAFLSCLNFPRFSDRDHIVEELSRSTPEDLAGLLRTYTGGLIEIYGKDLKLQLLHQTTMDFVQLPEFKAIIFGSNSYLMADNGYTFLAKSAFLRFPRCYGNFHVSVEALRHARLSESTTGRSLYSFFSNDSSTFLLANSLTAMHGTSPDRWPSDSMAPDLYANMYGSIMGLAFGGYLRILIEDALKANQLVLSETTCCCLGSIIFCFLNKLCDLKEAIHMVDNLAAHEFKFENHVDWLAVALHKSRYDTENSKLCEPIILHITRKFSNPNIRLKQTTTYDWTFNEERHRNDHLKASMIHLSSYNITKDLLSRQANPNIEDIYGYTPLDYYAMGYFAISAKLQHGLMALLAQNGGRLNISTKKQWKLRMQFLQNAGLDISVFEKLRYPKWLKNPKSTRGPRGWLRCPLM
ncbi:hypothetical protein J3F84DRAFT_380388 [Trichoderma pleuroticola]